MAVLDNKINTVRVKDPSGALSDAEYPIGALASNIAVDSLESEISVQDKINDYNDFIKKLSTDKVKYTKNEVTQTLTEYLEKNITTDNKSTGIVEQEENDDSAYVTAKGVIDYLASKTNDIIQATAAAANDIISSTEETPNDNLVTDNAIFTYVTNAIINTEGKIPIAAETLDESENTKYITVELFNSKYINMFEGDLADDTTDITTLVNPNQVVAYVKSKTETGEIEENSTKLVTSGTLYTKFAELNFPSKASLILSTTEDDSSYVTPLAVKNYVELNAPIKYVEITIKGEETIYNYDFTDLVEDDSAYVSPEQVVNYVHTKYIGTVEDIQTEVDTGEIDEEGKPIVEIILTGKKVIHTPLKDIIPEDESTLDINDIYFKGFVTPKQVVDYVALQSHNVDTALRKYIGITGTVAETGNLLPDMEEGVTILSRLAAVEEAVKLITTTTN